MKTETYEELYKQHCIQLNREGIYAQNEINLKSDDLYERLGLLYPGIGSYGQDAIGCQYRIIKESFLYAIKNAISYPEVAEAMFADLAKLDEAYNILNSYSDKMDYDIFHICRFGDPDDDDAESIHRLYNPVRVKLVDKYGNTPFLLACTCQNWAAVETLLELNPILIDELDESQKNKLLIDARMFGRTELVKLLVEQDSMSSQSQEASSSSSRATRKHHILFTERAAGDTDSEISKHKKLEATSEEENLDAPAANI